MIESSSADARYQEVVELTAAHLNPGLSRLMAFAGFGVETRGEGCTVYDHEGRPFLDCLGGYGTFALGHRHPRIVAAVRAQLEDIALSAKAFFNEPAARLAADLAARTEGALPYTFFSNSGAEAVEAALKFARIATGRPGFISTFGGYHGKTMGALSVTGRDKYRKPFDPLVGPVQFVPYNDLDAVRHVMNPDVAAVIVEPIQGEGGIVIPDDAYLAGLREICDRNGSLLIFDEVQTGIGRTGHLFAHERAGVRPDLMTLAKALGGGVMPIGATLGTADVFSRAFGENPLAHTSTFGGNALACAAARETLRVVDDEQLLARSAERGAQMLARFAAVAAKYPELVADVRGRGLMIGLEFALDEVGELVVSQLLKRGVCVAYALNNPRVLRFEPPLVITEVEVDTVANALDESIAEVDELIAELR
ncbi:MAG: aspartate aminotransferase family protein [Fimbriimonadaceae bacterium]|nr:aspartate aminotransferase family protein [Fimbriimonadaceae bacterium]